MLQVAFLWVRDRRVEKMHLITLVLILVFGGLTVALKDDTFIKWKPTILNWLFTCVLLFSDWVLGKNLIRKMLEANISLPDPIWRNLNTAWSIFFLICGGLNLYVAYSFSQETWVNFKVFGLLALTLVFAVSQMAILSRFIKEPDQSDTTH